jgi:hypothetical protein
MIGMWPEWLRMPVTPGDGQIPGMAQGTQVRSKLWRECADCLEYLPRDKLRSQLPLLRQAAGF